MPTSRIHLADLWPAAAEPVRLYGDFNAADELTYASAPDMELAWCRFQGETAERFSRRVANEIRAARGLPPLSECAPLETRAGATPPDARGRHQPRHDGMVPGRGGPARARVTAE